MTKMIRVENADTSTYEVLVHTEEQRADGAWHRIRTEKLAYPTAMLSAGIHSTQRLVIEEVKS